MSERETLQREIYSLIEVEGPLTAEETVVKLKEVYDAEQWHIYTKSRVKESLDSMDNIFKDDSGRWHLGNLNE